MAATPEELKLIEKIIRAKVKLEGAKKAHTQSCMIEMDPDYTGPCTCGTTEHNKIINAVLEELK